MESTNINELYNTLLTNDDVDNIVDKLKDIRKNTEELNVMENAKNNPPYDIDDNKLSKAKIMIDNNGMEQIFSVYENNSEIPNEIIPDSNIDLESLFNEKIIYNKDGILNDIKSEHNLSNEDALILFNLLISDFENDNDIYYKLPDKLKDTIDANIQDNIKTKNKFTKFLLNEMKQSFAFESSIVELNDTIRKEMDMSNLNKSIIEETDIHFEQKIKMIIESTDNNKSNKHKIEKLQKSLNAYKDAKDFSRIRTVRLFTGKLTKKKYLERESKLIKAYLTEFNNRYKNHKYGINDINSFYHILIKLFPDIDVNDINKFIILFCIYCRGLKVNKIEDHIFMYYTIKNILNVYDLNNMESEYSKYICDNFRNIIEYIKSL